MHVLFSAFAIPPGFMCEGAEVISVPVCFKKMGSHEMLECSCMTELNIIEVVTKH
jgi:hypothetical protein